MYAEIFNSLIISLSVNFENKTIFNIRFDQRQCRCPYTEMDLLVQ